MNKKERDRLLVVAIPDMVKNINRVSTALSKEYSGGSDTLIQEMTDIHYELIEFFVKHPVVVKSLN